VNAAPVGVFDSGVGGLSVLEEIRALLPDESLDYVADSGHAPWGDKPVEFVRDRSLKIGRFLVGQGAKAIVIACNTGTAAAADTLRGKLTVPVVAMEPGIKPAAAATRSGVVGAIVTAMMSDSDRMASLLDRFGHSVKVIAQPAPGLADRVEDADLDSPALRALVVRYLRPLIDAGADTIVLGSTHYVFLKAVMAEVAGPAVTLIDTGPAVARQLSRVLGDRGLSAPAGAAARERFWTSGDVATSERVMSTLLGRRVSVGELPA
jgi:glutamate racemase